MLDRAERYVRRGKSLAYIADKLGVDVCTLVSEIAASDINLNNYTGGIDDRDVLTEAREAFLYGLLQDD